MILKKVLIFPHKDIHIFLEEREEEEEENLATLLST